MRRFAMRRMLALGGIIAVVVLAVAAPASAATIAATPSTVPTSGTVTLSGDVLINGTRGCPVGDDVTLISNAFVGFSEFAGQGALVVPVDSTGHFTSTVTLKSS